MRDRLPWFVWASLALVSSIVIGMYWDISWHMSIGRDSFWTPAHIAIQAGGIIAGLSGALLILTTTFRRDSALRPASIRVWGFHGPFGAFLGVWGAATMVVSAPFDNWWHGAYGLDVKILSPPHMVLTLGILAVAVAGVLLVLAAMNRAHGLAHARLGLALFVIGGEILVLAMTAILEHTIRANLHRADAYRAMALVVPVVLLALAQASNRTWGATILAAFYTAFMIAMLWLFQRFPAEPKLGPVYQSITHFIPLEFPPLVIVPAIAFDLVRRRVAWPRGRLALVLGATFLVTLVAVEWPFAGFLQSPAARNGWFGGDYFAYFLRPEWDEPSHVFRVDDAPVIGMLEALGAAIATSYLGLVLGNLMRAVRR
ncbi:MAG TPA: hypothetical protein VHW23_01465 [Kofleriaceae bacterium]|jgi:hypothetical protein|nr:hypothetical protein [Kofleriaceae bacterium]